MEAVQFVLPTIGTIALGAALLVPLRDGRRGRRATLGGAPTPLRARFVTKAESSYPAEGAGSDVIDATDACDRTNGVGDGASRETHVRADVGADVGPPPIRAESETFESVPPTRGTTAHPRALDDDACSAHATTSCEDGPIDVARTRDTFADAVAAAASATRVDRDAAIDAPARAPNSVVAVFASMRELLRASAPTRRAAGREKKTETRKRVATDSSSDAPFACDLMESRENHDEASESNRFDIESRDVAISPHERLAFSLVPGVEERHGSDDAIVAAQEPERPSASAVADVSLRRGSAPSDSDADGFERVVPLTRLPLRPVASEIRWTEALGDDRGRIPAARNERHAVLGAIVTGKRAAPDGLVVAAYFEEDLEGRMLALRALLARPNADRAPFVDALKRGSDDERALAVDGLDAFDDRDALVPALGDRVEAIAARAALAIARTTDRAAFVASIARHVDESRLAQLLAMLAGIVE